MASRRSTFGQSRTSHVHHEVALKAKHAHVKYARRSAGAPNNAHHAPPTTSPQVNMRAVGKAIVRLAIGGAGNAQNLARRMRLTLVFLDDDDDDRAARAIVAELRARDTDDGVDVEAMVRAATNAVVTRHVTTYRYAPLAARQTAEMSPTMHATAELCRAVADAIADGHDVSVHPHAGRLVALPSFEHAAAAARRCKNSQSASRLRAAARVLITAGLPNASAHEAANVTLALRQLADADVDASSAPMPHALLRAAASRAADAADHIQPFEAPALRQTVARALINLPGAGACMARLDDALVASCVARWREDETIDGDVALASLGKFAEHVTDVGPDKVARLSLAARPFVDDAVLRLNAARGDGKTVIPCKRLARIAQDLVWAGCASPGAVDRIAIIAADRAANESIAWQPLMHAVQQLSAAGAGLASVVALDTLAHRAKSEFDAVTFRGDEAGKERETRGRMLAASLAASGCSKALTPWNDEALLVAFRLATRLPKPTTRGVEYEAGVVASSMASLDASLPRLGVDLGCGVGGFVLGEALGEGGDPNRAWLGVDACEAAVRRATGLAVRCGGSGRVAFAHCTAESAIHSLLSLKDVRGRVDAVTMHFPTPPKTTSAEDETLHGKMGFLLTKSAAAGIATLLRESGIMFIASNDATVCTRVASQMEVYGMRVVGDSSPFRGIAETEAASRATGRHVHSLVLCSSI